MNVNEMFKIENKEYAISGSGVNCQYCNEYLAKFELAMFKNHCSDCHYRR
jgi:hypothetical protein